MTNTTQDNIFRGVGTVLIVGEQIAKLVLVVFLVVKLLLQEIDEMSVFALLLLTVNALTDIRRELSRANYMNDIEVTYTEEAKKPEESKKA